MNRWDKFLDTFFNAKVMAKYLPDILSGVVLTIELALAIIVTGLLAGLFLALVRSLGIRPLNWLIIFVVDLFRSLPPLVIIVLIYFGLPAAGVSPSGFVSTWLSLAFVLMAFSEEIFWAGITSVHKRRSAFSTQSCGIWPPVLSSARMPSRPSSSCNVCNCSATRSGVPMIILPRIASS